VRLGQRLVLARHFDLLLVLKHFFEAIGNHLKIFEFIVDFGAKRLVDLLCTARNLSNSLVDVAGGSIQLVEIQRFGSLRSREVRFVHGASESKLQLGGQKYDYFRFRAAIRFESDAT